MTGDHLVIFTPSGKRGRFAAGTPVLTAARQLGVDLNSVCGGRGICSKCQVTPGYGEFPKHGVTVSDGALSGWNAVEERYKSKRGMIEGRRLGCQATIQGDVVIDVPPESQVHKQVVRKAADTRAIVMDPATRLYYVEVAEPDMHEPSGDFERLKAALRDQWQIEGVEAPLVGAAGAPARAAEGRVGGDRGGAQGAPGRAPPGDRRLAGVLGGAALRPRRRRGVDDHRGASDGPEERVGAGVLRRDEPADPLRGGPDEPGLLRDDEPGRRGRDDEGRAGGAERAGGGSGDGGRHRGAADRGDGVRLQPRDAPPPPRDRPGGAWAGALRARDLRVARPRGGGTGAVGDQPGGADLHPALHRGACGRGRRGGGAGRGARPVGGPRAGGGRGHERGDPAREHRARARLLLAHRTGLRGRPDLLGPAGGAGGHRAGGDRRASPRSRGSG